MYKVIIKDLEKYIIKLNSYKSLINSSIFCFGNYNLSTSMNSSKWVKVIYNKNIATVFKKDLNMVYYVQISNNKYEVKYMVKNKVLFIFQDNYISNSKFKRVLNKNHIYIIENNDMVLKKIQKKVSFIKPLIISIFRSDKFITIDLETRIIDSIINVISASIYNGKHFKLFYITKYNG